MRICKYCGKSFLPAQTFKNLFKSPTVCPPCDLITKRPLRLERLPLEKSELILFTHDHESHPALTADVFDTIVRENVCVIFHDSLERAPKEAWKTLATLFNPVVIYHAEFPTLDRLERFLKWFESEV